MAIAIRTRKQKPCSPVSRTEPTPHGLARPEPGIGGAVRNLNYYWRLAITGACFAVFGIGGVFLSILVFPAMRILSSDPRRRGLRVKWLIHKFFGALIYVLRLCGVMRLEVEGKEHLGQCQGMLVLANHPTYIDVVVLLSLMPSAGCVVKAALWRSPFFGGVVRAAGYISNSTPDKLIGDCAEHLADGHPLIIFPEGTRSVPEQPLKFLRGASYIAMKSGKPVLPVLIICDPPTLTKADRWYHIPPRPFHFRVSVQPPQQVTEWTENDGPQAISARRLTEALETFFIRKLHDHGIARTRDQIAYC